MEHFYVNSESLIAIYGLSNIGKQKCKELLNNGYNIIGIIDQNADSLLEYCGVAVYTLDKFSELFPGKEEIVTIICLNNALQHEKVAYELSSYGYKRLLYIPMDETRSYEYLEEMQSMYLHFEEGSFDNLKKIPLYENKSAEEIQDIQIISKSPKTVSFLCEIEYLFSPGCKQLKEHAANRLFYERGKKDQRYLDKPVVSFEPYIDLFNFMMGRVGYPVKYMEYFGEDGDYNKSLLSDRIDLFQCFEKRYNKDMRLFYLQPTTAVWNDEKKYFNICDGMHRLMFLYYVKKHFKVPIRTSKESFERFCKSYKKKEYIYKSVELVLQELLPSTLFLGEGAIVANSIDNFDYEFKWGKYAFYKEIEEIPQAKEYSWIFYKSESHKIQIELLDLLFKYSSYIIIECSGERVGKEDEINSYNIINIKEVLTENLARKVFYLLKKEK